MALLSLAAIAEEEYAEATLSDYFDKKNKCYPSSENQILVKKEEKQKQKSKRSMNDRLRDNERFKCFVFDHMSFFFTGDATGPNQNVRFAGLDMNFEDILYHCMRCKLVHTSGMPRIYLMEGNLKTNQLGMYLGDPMGFTHNFVLRIINVVQGRLNRF